MLKIVAEGGYSIGDRAGNCKKKAPRKADALRGRFVGAAHVRPAALWEICVCGKAGGPGMPGPYGAAHVWVKVLSFFAYFLFRK